MFTQCHNDVWTRWTFRTKYAKNGAHAQCLAKHDSDFNAFSRIVVAPDVAFTEAEPEPEIENLLPPDPPGAFVPEEVAPPYQPHSPEHMALWLIQQITEKLNYAMEAGRPHVVQRNVERRQIMVGICRVCDERPELRMETWNMMQSLSALSDSEGEDDE